MPSTSWFDPSELEDPNGLTPDFSGADSTFGGLIPSGSTFGLDPNNSAGQTIQQLIANLGKHGQPGGTAADLASLASSYATDQQRNRKLQGDFTQNYDRLMLEAQTGRNQNESDALRKLAVTKYLQAGGYQAPTTPQTMSLNGQVREIFKTGSEPTAASDDQKAGASALAPQLVSRLAPGGSYTPQPLSDYARPGTVENIGQYGALGLAGLGELQNTGVIGGDGGGGGNTGGKIISDIAGGAGLAKNLGLFGKSASTAADASGTGGAAATGAGSVMGKVLGKAVPIAGAGLGLYQMLQNKGLASNLMGGASAGASIGSMVVPGIGTAIGAGIGAIAGAIESAFNIGKPSAQELAGRSAHDYMNQKLSSGASPAQMAEAQQAVKTGGWKDPQAAAALIVVRDNLIKGGMNPSDAVAKSNQVMGQIANNVKSGASAVQSASSPIQSMMGGRA